MSATLELIQSHIRKGQYFISRHALAEAEDDAIPLTELLAAMPEAVAVEDYPDAKRGPSVLCLIRLHDGRAVHAVWGIPNPAPDKAGLVTVYRPETTLWSADFLKRISQ